MAGTDLFARRATLTRSVRLLSQFRYEQSDPARFYGALADDTATMITDLWRGTRGDEPAGRTLLDVGGGPGYFATAFAETGLRYIGVEPDADEMHAAGPRPAAGAGSFVRASGMALPFADASVDICLSSNVAEHVPRPWQLGDEMLRVTRPGGLVVLSYTVWLGPFGGHEMGLTHYLGGRRAARTPASMATRRRTTTARRCSRCRPQRGWTGPATPAPWSRLSPLSPAMGVVDHFRAGHSRVRREQSRAGSRAQPNPLTATCSNPPVS